MTYMTSTASNQGSASIQVFFEQHIDPDIAAVNVQNRVARANALLPREVVQSGVITQKQQTSSLMYASVYSKNPDYDRSEERRVGKEGESRRCRCKCMEKKMVQIYR